MCLAPIGARARCSGRLGRVVGVDADVAGGQVAAPHGARRRAGAERDVDANLVAAQVVRPRRQVGSAPWTAVLTSGELTIAFATRLACSRSRALSTTTSISVSAPSPSR